MTLAEQYLKDGKLQDALVELQNQVKKDPANAKLRVFLFQLLALLGDWQRALTQLNVSGDLDAANLAMVQTYREAIRCELLRRQIFSGTRTPLIFGDPERWVALLLEALRLTAVRNISEAKVLRDQAFELAPVSSGTINGDPFDWVADADTRLGPVLEVILNGRYYWVPFHRIARIQIEPPEDLRDFVWMPAHFTWSNGGDAVGLIPTRYPDSENADEAAIRMARKTEWLAQGDEVYFGIGQRLLATPDSDYALMDIRDMSFNSDVAK